MKQIGNQTVEKSLSSVVQGLVLAGYGDDDPRKIDGAYEFDLPFHHLLMSLKADNIQVANMISLLSNPCGKHQSNYKRLGNGSLYNSSPLPTLCPLALSGFHSDILYDCVGAPSPETNKLAPRAQPCSAEHGPNYWLRNDKGRKPQKKRVSTRHVKGTHIRGFQKAGEKRNKRI
jgi:hypothetical protein